MNSTIIILGGSISSNGFFRAARHRGFSPILFDKNHRAYCRKYCNSFFPISTHSFIEVITQLKHLPEGTEIQGVLCYSSFPGALKTTSFLCEEYKLSGFSAKAVNLCYNKILMKHILTNADIRCPKVYLIKPHEQESTDQVLEKVEFPCVVKPSGGIGSLNVRKIDCREELKKYLYEYAGDFNDLVFEEYIDGFFLHVDGFVQKQNPTIISYSEKFVEFQNGVPLTKGYRLIEDVHTVVDNQQLIKIESQIRQGLASLGIDNHFFGADVIVSKSGGIYFLEMGFLMDAKMDRLLRHAGLDIYGYLVDIVTGKQIPTKNIPVPQKGYALRFLYAGNDGILLKKENWDSDILAEWEKEDGDIVSPPQSVADIVGWLIASGSNSLEAWGKCIADTDRCYFSTTKTV